MTKFNKFYASVIALTVATSSLSTQAHAFKIAYSGAVPIVALDITKYEEFVPLSALPEAFRGPIPMDQWRGKFAYFKEYRKGTYWYGFFRVSASGLGEFSNQLSNSGGGIVSQSWTENSTATLVDHDGNDLHTLFCKLMSALR